MDNVDTQRCLQSVPRSVQNAAPEPDETKSIRPGQELLDIVSVLSWVPKWYVHILERMRLGAERMEVETERQGASFYRRDVEAGD